MATESSGTAATTPAINLMAAFPDEDVSEDAIDASFKLPGLSALTTMDGWLLTAVVGSTAAGLVALSMAGIVAYRCTVGRRNGRTRLNAPKSTIVDLDTAVYVVKTIRKRMEGAKTSLLAAKRAMMARMQAAQAAGQPLQGLPRGMDPAQAIQIMLQQQAGQLMQQAESGAFQEHEITGAQFDDAVKAFAKSPRFTKEAVKLKEFMDSFTKEPIPKALDSKEAALQLFEDLMQGYCDAFGQAFKEVKSELHADDTDEVMRADAAAMKQVKQRGGVLTNEAHARVTKEFGHDIVDTVLQKYLTAEEIAAKKSAYALEWKEKFGIDPFAKKRAPQ
jgi:hypothetical protein